MARRNAPPHSMRLTPRQPAAPQRKKKSAVSRTTQPAPEARHNLAQPVRAGNHFPIRSSTVGATRSSRGASTNRHIPPTSAQINAVILRASDKVRHVDSGGIYRRCPKNLNLNTTTYFPAIEPPKFSTCHTPTKRSSPKSRNFPAASHTGIRTNLLRPMRMRQSSCGSTLQRSLAILSQSQRDNA